MVILVIDIAYFNKKLKNKRQIIIIDPSTSIPPIFRNIRQKNNKSILNNQKYYWK